MYDVDSTRKYILADIDVHQRGKKQFKNSVLQLSHSCTDVMPIHIELIMYQISHSSSMIHDPFPLGSSANGFVRGV